MSIGVIFLYFLSVVWFRRSYVAVPSRQWLLGRLDALRLSADVVEAQTHALPDAIDRTIDELRDRAAGSDVARLRTRSDDLRKQAQSLPDKDKRAVEEIVDALDKQLDRWEIKLLPARWRRTRLSVNTGWLAVHQLERLLVRYIEPEAVYARLRRSRASLATERGATAALLRPLVERHLDAAGNKRTGSNINEARADLESLLSHLHRANDMYFVELEDVYNKSFWLILIALVFVLGVTVVWPDVIPILGLGALGGLASRVQRFTTAKRIPTDYGALWAPLWLGPVLGAILAFIGVLVLQLGQVLDIISLTAVDFKVPTSPAVLGLAALFGFSERMFNGVAETVISRAVAPNAEQTVREPAVVPIAPPPEPPPPSGGTPPPSGTTSPPPRATAPPAPAAAIGAPAPAAEVEAPDAEAVRPAAPPATDDSTELEPGDTEVRENELPSDQDHH